jgi:predicted phosphodiesterase
MKAIISDIHGNLEALEAVMEDIKSRGISEVVCLGDVIGYGPNPRECLQGVKEVGTLICGNHEEALLSGNAQTFNTRARRAVEWTRQQLFGDDVVTPEVAEDNRGILARFEIDVNIEGIRYVHGSPRNPTKEYVTPRDAKNVRKMGEIFAALETVCFIGHSHVPGVFTEEGHTSPKEMFNVYMLSGEKALINVGSVGQPRDSDPRACYCTFDVDTVVYHRVEYDVEAVVAKIRATASLDNTLAERLRTGK